MLKVKVGGKAGPSEDASRTVQLLQQCAFPKCGVGRSSSSSSGGTLRLDANQAWTMEEALQFSTALAAAAGGRRLCDSGGSSTGRGGETGIGGSEHEAEGVDLGLVEYVEEPLRDPRFLETFWERSGKLVPYALDESLGMGREIFTDEVR